jgi:very-short-patch-repair endonuclease
MNWLDYVPAVELICRALGLPFPVAEFRFAMPRKWAFDFAFVEQRVALEVQGGIWTRGRHSRGKGQEGDMEKLNAAQALGWRVLWVSPAMLQDGRALRALEAVFHPTTQEHPR